MQKAYKYAVLYFLAFSLLLMTSSVLLFSEKIGFSSQAIVEYYLGNEDKFIVAKSFSGVLKIVLPHIFAFGLFVMVILHFVVFTKTAKAKYMTFFIYTLFFVSLLELFTPLLIINGYESFAYLKLISFVLFVFLVLYILWILFRSIIFE